MQPHTAAQRRTLLQIGDRSIEHGLRYEQPLSVDLHEYDAALRLSRGCFVTLRLWGRLRGCIGSIEATQPLVEAVSRQAFGAAFRDPRFEPLRAEEHVHTTLSISVLSELQPMTVRDEHELLEQLCPGTDGLLIEAGDKRATFLPAVWESLPEPRDFVAELKRKAGLAPADWPATIMVSRYTSETF